MIKNIFAKTQAKSSTTNNATDVQQAATILLLKMAAADSNVSRIEMIHLTELLRKEFKLEQTEVNSMLATASHKDVLETSTQELTKQLCASFGNAKRMKLLEYLWVLAYSDDNIDTRETKFIQQTAELLSLTDMEKANAQENAEEHLGLDLF